jgi:hypothetical protein
MAEENNAETPEIHFVLVNNAHDPSTAFDG